VERPGDVDGPVAPLACMPETATSAASSVMALLGGMTIKRIQSSSPRTR